MRYLWGCDATNKRRKERETKQGTDQEWKKTHNKKENG